MTDLPHTPTPTAAELPLLRILWERGPSTVRDIWGELPGDRTVRYTTVLKLLQIMHGKGLVGRDESARSHVYAAAVDESTTEARLVNELVDRGFAGSVARLVRRLLTSGAATEEDLKEIRNTLEQLEEGMGTT